MPSYDFDYNDKVWKRECSRCRMIVVGTADEQESIKIFQQVFTSRSLVRGAPTDGMNSTCRDCNSPNRVSLGIGRAELEIMWQSQQGKCAICQDEISIVNKASNCAHVDHDRTSHTVRGLLCANCNTGIGKFKHDIVKLRRAINYLLKHEHKVLPFRRRI